MEKTLHSDGYKLLVRRLREARQSRGISQVELAARLNTTQVFVSKCEQGGRRIDALELRVWCDALGLPFLSFLADLDHELGSSGL